MTAASLVAMPGFPYDDPDDVASFLHLGKTEAKLQELREQLRQERCALQQREYDVSHREREVANSLRRLEAHPEAKGLLYGEVDDLLRSSAGRQIFARLNGAAPARSPARDVEADEQLRQVAQAIRTEIIRHFGIGRDTDEKMRASGQELIRSWVRQHISSMGKDLILALCGITKGSFGETYKVETYGDNNPTMKDLQALARKELLATIGPEIAEVMKAAKPGMVEQFKTAFTQKLKDAVVAQASMAATQHATEMVAQIGKSMTEEVILEMFPFIDRLNALEKLGRKTKPIDEAV